MKTEWTPKQLSGIDQALPTSVKDMMPEYKDLPPEFTDRRHPMSDVVSRWFFRGLPKGTEFKPKEGIDKDAALRHIKYVLGSWEPKHEHKEAGVAFLLNEWFEAVKIPEEVKA